MPPIEFGPTRPLGAVEARTHQFGAKAPGASPGDPAKPAAATKIVHSEALDPGTPPVDAERVAVIRKAIEQGTYPVLPAKIADAVIAAGMLLRTPK